MNLVNQYLSELGEKKISKEEFEQFCHSLAKTLDKETIAKSTFGLSDYTGSIGRLLKKCDSQVFADLDAFLALLHTILYEEKDYYIYPVCYMSEIMPLAWFSENWDHFKQVYRRHDGGHMLCPSLRVTLPDLFELSNHPDLTLDFVLDHLDVGMSRWETDFNWDPAVMCRRFLIDDQASKDCFMEHPTLFISPALKEIAWFTDKFIEEHLDTFFGKHITYERGPYTHHFEPGYPIKWDSEENLELHWLDKILESAKRNIPQFTYGYHYDHFYWKLELAGFSGEKISRNPNLTARFVKQHPKVAWDLAFLVEKFGGEKELHTWISPKFLVEQLVTHGGYHFFYKSFPECIRKFVASERFPYKKHKKAIALFTDFMIAFMCHGVRKDVIQREIVVKNEMWTRLKYDSEYRRRMFFERCNAEDLREENPSLHPLRKAFLKANNILLDGYQTKKESHNKQKNLL